jgi:hypothetical protein
MPLYKNYGVIASGMSLEDQGKPGRYVPFASVFSWKDDGSFTLARQYTWSEVELESADAARVHAQRLAQQAIDGGEVC